jgi:hypothetical protein
MGWGWHGDFGGGIRGSGQMQSEPRNAGEFTSISVEYPATVIIQQGSIQELTIEAENNLLPQLATEMRGDTLRIFNRERNWNRRVNPSEPITIWITVDALKALDFLAAGSVTIEGITSERLEIALDGAGQINLVDISVERLLVSLNGAGDVVASGSADSIDLDIDGLGQFRGLELAAQEVDVQINGAGDAEISVSSQLSVEINGAGSVSYIGNPGVQQEINGLGSVTQR